jgi:predicted amidohydrolase
MESAPAGKAANLVRIRAMAERAAKAGARIVVSPECSITGYWFMRNLSDSDFAALAEPVPSGPSSQAIVARSRELGISIGAGLIEAAPDGRLFNSYLVAHPDGATHVHRKLHAFEHGTISCGDSYTVFDTPYGVRTAVLICYDCNVIENARACALAGAEMLLAPHQTGGCKTTNPHLMGLIERSLWLNRESDPAAIEAEFRGEKGRGWLLRWLPSRAHDNGMFIVFSNGVGIDDDEVRTGNAMVLDPYGRILNETWRAADDLVVADCDLSLLEHATGRLWIRARRPELYAALAQRSGLERSALELKFEE